MSLFDLATANSAQLSVFGETVTINVGGTDHAGMQAIFFDPYKGQSALGINVDRPRQEFQMRQSDWDGINGAAGATITRADGTVYTVVNPVPDQGDWIKLQVNG